MTVAEADRLAKEIMSGKSSNRHTSEERGHVVDDSGVCPLTRPVAHTSLCPILTRYHANRYSYLIENDRGL